jgi:hypothetical protein
VCWRRRPCLAAHSLSCAIHRFMTAGPMSTDEELRAALQVAGWPTSLAHDASKRPKVLKDVVALAEVVLFSSHVNEIFVLPNGVHLMGHDKVLPAYITHALQGASSVRDFLGAIDEETLRGLRGRVYCTSEDLRDEKELKTHAGEPLDTLADKRRALSAAHPEGNIYLGELRYKERYRHPLDSRWVKTVLVRDVKDFLGRDRGEAMPYWDRCRWAGRDQCLRVTLDHRPMSPEVAPETCCPVRIPALHAV